MNENPETGNACKIELTKRESEVFALLAQGHPNKVVADTLGISMRTAENHRKHIMRKLEIHSISELVLYAVRTKLANL